MLGGISGELLRSPSSNDSRVSWTGCACVYNSVDPHQIMTRRSAPELFLNCRMSSMTCSARSILVLPVFRLLGCSLLTHVCSNAAGMGLIDRKSVVLGK